jgi:hypothetical protein
MREVEEVNFAEGKGEKRSLLLVVFLSQTHSLACILCITAKVFFYSAL